MVAVILLVLWSHAWASQPDVFTFSYDRAGVEHVVRVEFVDERTVEIQANSNGLLGDLKSARLGRWRVRTNPQLTYFRILLQQTEERERTRRVQLPMGALTARPTPHALRILAGTTILDPSQVPQVNEFFTAINSAQVLDDKFSTAIRFTDGHVLVGKQKIPAGHLCTRSGVMWDCALPEGRVRFN